MYVPLTSVGGGSQAEPHTEWLFSAVAELVDNAHDAGATNLHIKMINMRGLWHLVFLDDGHGEGSIGCPFKPQSANIKEQFLVAVSLSGSG